MIRILVASATRHGATAEIAAEIADVLRRDVAGAVVDLRDAAKAGDVAAHDAAVIGSAVYLGRWLPAARNLVEGHREVFSAMPVWLFSSGPLGDPPVPADGPAEVVALGVAVGARGHRLFAGRLDRQELRWVERATTRVVHAPEGDFRDHDEIRQWASGVASALTAGSQAAPVSGASRGVRPAMEEWNG
jgi:menaquinone-dependent protoporphyrinogen oxidase